PGDCRPSSTHPHTPNIRSIPCPPLFPALRHPRTIRPPEFIRALLDGVVPFHPRLILLLPVEKGDLIHNGSAKRFCRSSITDHIPLDIVGHFKTVPFAEKPHDQRPGAKIIPTATPRRDPAPAVNLAFRLFHHPVAIAIH